MVEVYDYEPFMDSIHQSYMTTEALPYQLTALGSIFGVISVTHRLGTAERPLILAGRGVLLADVTAPLRNLGNRVGALLTTSVMAASAFNSSWDLGIAGGFTRNHRLELARQTELVLVVGASLDTFQTRHGTLFPAGTRVVLIDNEPPSVQPFAGQYVRADILAFVEGLLQRVAAGEAPTWRDRAPQVAEARFRSSDPVEDPAGFGSDGRPNQRTIVAALERLLPAEPSVVTDCGHFIGWAPMYRSALEEWLATHDEGVFVLDVAISQKVVAGHMAASLEQSV